MMMGLMPNCRELARALAGEGFAGWPWPRRLAARLHLWHCAVCARFARQLARIDEALRAAWAAPLPDTRLRSRILSRLEGL